MDDTSQPPPSASDDQVNSISEAEEQAYWLAMQLPFSNRRLAEALNSIISLIPAAKPITDSLWKAALDGLGKAKVISLQVSPSHFSVNGMLLQ